MPDAFGATANYSYGDVVQKLLQGGKFYEGGWPRKGDETTADYFHRLLAPLEGSRRGLIAAYWINPKKETPEQVLHLWHTAHGV